LLDVDVGATWDCAETGRVQPTENNAITITYMAQSFLL
jgi:hypothetical protein